MDANGAIRTMMMVVVRLMIARREELKKKWKRIIRVVDHKDVYLLDVKDRNGFVKGCIEGNNN